MVRRKREKLNEFEKKVLEIISDPDKILKFFDAAAYLGIAYFGYRAAKHPAGALAGVIGLKLATTMGGTPPVSQIAGLSILGTIGALNVRWNRQPDVEASTPPPEELPSENLGEIG